MRSTTFESLWYFHGRLIHLNCARTCLRTLCTSLGNADSRGARRVGYISIRDAWDQCPRTGRKYGMYRAVTRQREFSKKTCWRGGQSLMRNAYFFSEFLPTRRLPDVNIHPKMDEICDRWMKNPYLPIIWISCVTRRLEEIICPRFKWNISW